MLGMRKYALESALGAGLVVCLAAGSAAANPVNPNGWTADLQLATPLPEGIFFIDTGTYLERSGKTNLTIDAGVNLPVLVWSTPVTFLGGRLEVIGTAPEVGVGTRGALDSWSRGMYNPAGLVGMAWDLGGGFTVSDFVGGFIPVDTEVGQIGNLGVGGLGGNFWTFIESASVAYNHDGWSLSANGFYGHSGNDQSTGLYTQPDTLSVDFAATKHFGKLEIGLVGYASTDLNGASWNTDIYGGIHRQSQIALGGLVGYDFGPVSGQLYVTRDVAEDNYTGYDTRVWGRLVIPLWVAPKAAPVLAAKY
jgi:hypothetical protein